MTKPGGRKNGVIYVSAASATPLKGNVTDRASACVNISSFPSNDRLAALDLVERLDRLRRRLEVEDRATDLAIVDRAIAEGRIAAGLANPPSGVANERAGNRPDQRPAGRKIETIASCRRDRPDGEVGEAG